MLLVQTSAYISYLVYLKYNSFLFDKQIQFFSLIFTDMCLFGRADIGTLLGKLMASYYRVTDTLTNSINEARVVTFIKLDLRTLLHTNARYSNTQQK